MKGVLRVSVQDFTFYLSLEKDGSFSIRVSFGTGHRIGSILTQDQECHLPVSLQLAWLRKKKKIG